MPKDRIEIIYQDDNLLVINKPAGISVTADRSGADDLLAVLQKQLAAAAKLRLVHRLDKDTSGVMLIAKNIESQRSLTEMFEKHLVKKLYLALVTGYIPAQSGTINALLTQDPRDHQKMVVADKKAKEAVTNWRLLADFGLYALLAVEPLTGRTHQIRVHLNHAGMPLAIDPLYGSSRPLMLSEVKSGYRHSKSKDESPLINRLTLHSYQLTLPAEGDRPATFVAPLDKKFTATLKMLTKHNPNGINALKDSQLLEKILSAQLI